MVGPWRPHLIAPIGKTSHLKPIMCFRPPQKKKVKKKSWITDNRCIKTLLGWKFRVQDLFHEFEVLLVSLAHLVAHIGWAFTKCSYETDPYPQNHFSSISPICRKNWYQQWSIQYYSQVNSSRVYIHSTTNSIRSGGEFLNSQSTFKDIWLVNSDYYWVVVGFG